MTHNKKIEDFQGNMTKEFYANIRRKPDKSFFFELEFTTNRNIDYDPNPNRDDPTVVIYSPQINNITMEMPNVPLLTNWNQINKV